MICLRNAFAFLLVFVFVWKTPAEQPRSKGPTADQRRRMEIHNKLMHIQPLLSNVPSLERPYAEYERAAYLMMTEDFHFGSELIKRGLVEDLPDGVTAVIFVDSPTEVDSVKKYFSQYIEESRLKVIHISGGAGFWSRDSLPIPVYAKKGSELALVDALYFHGYAPDEQIARYFGVELTKHNFYFEGGNFAADSRGNCITIERGSLTAEFFKTYYGCNNTLRLPHTLGIGHIDERVKIVDDKTVLTDTPSYVDALRNFGYDVHLLPRPSQGIETYVNSLLVNEVIFMPTFQIPETDKAAAQIYESLGFRVIQLDSKNLSNHGMGSIHCITMTYPKVDLEMLIQQRLRVWR